MTKISRSQPTFLLLLVCSVVAFGQLESAQSRIDSIVHQAKGIVGVAVIDLNNGDTLAFHGNDHFPMQSVFKFPLALTILDRIDKGTMHLSQMIHITKADLLPNTWSPIRDMYPSGDIDMPLDSLIRYTVSQSDNNGCDILIRLLGGTSVVNQYVHKLGVMDMSIAATEAEMHQEWVVQYRNWSSPKAMAKLLQLFHSGMILSQESKDYLWRIMARSASGPKRIRGLLPPGTGVAHKTGSSGTNEKGIAAATNDVGILSLPDNRHIAIAVFVSESDASEESRDNVIASIGRAVWDALVPRQ